MIQFLSNSALNLVQGPKHRPRPLPPSHTICLQVSLFCGTESPSQAAETGATDNCRTALGKTHALHLLGNHYLLSLGNSCATHVSKKHNSGKENVRKCTDCSLSYRLVKKLVSEKSEWVPSSILQPAEGDSNNIIKNSNAGNRGNVLLVFKISSVCVCVCVHLLKKEVIKSTLPILKYSS